MKEPAQATRAIVADAPGEPATLTLYDADGAVAVLALPSARCLALAADLLSLARERSVRPAVAARQAERQRFQERKTKPLRVLTPKHELFCQARAR